MHFHLSALSKENQHTGNNFNDVLPMLKQLGILTYFLILSCADLRWEELSYNFNKLNNL